MPTFWDKRNNVSQTVVSTPTSIKTRPSTTVASWFNPLNNKLVATGGSILDVSGYRVHTFQASGSFTVTSGSANIEICLLSGGGAGKGDGNGGGGGGGGGYQEYTITGVGVGTYSVAVGGGGPANTIGGASYMPEFFINTVGGGPGSGFATVGGAGASRFSQLCS